MKKIKYAFFLITIFGFFSCTNTRQEYSKVWIVMGTVCRVRILTDKPKKEAEAVLNSIYSELRRLDAIFNANIDSASAEGNNLKDLAQSLIQPDESELEMLNRMAGIKPVEVSSDLYELLKISLLFAEISDGAFNPAIGPLVKLWNIGFENASVPSKDEINKILPLLDYKNIELGADNKVFLQKKGMRLDLGGIAKGYAADKIAKIVLDSGIKDSLIDLGGNIFALGKNPSGKNWKIALKNPTIGEKNAFMNLDLQNASLVTSGNYERFMEKDGILYHHIFDSKTGYPVKTSLNASSIVSKSSLIADVLSTSTYVLGKEKSETLMEKLNELDSPIIDKMEDISCFLVYDNKSVSILGSKKNSFNIIDSDFFVNN